MGQYLRTYHLGGLKMKVSIIALTASLYLVSGDAVAHCWIGNEAAASLSTTRSSQLLDYRARHTVIQRQVRVMARSSASFKPMPQPAPVRIPPPPPGTGSNGGDPFEPSVIGTFDSCSLLFGLVTDTFNSAYCHVKTMAEDGSPGDQVMCLASYPGSPDAVRHLADGITIARASDPGKAAAQLALDKLTTFLGEEFVCDGTTTYEEFFQNHQAFLYSKKKFEDEVNNL